MGVNVGELIAGSDNVGNEGGLGRRRCWLCGDMRRRGISRHGINERSAHADSRLRGNDQYRGVSRVRLAASCCFLFATALYWVRLWRGAGHNMACDGKDVAAKSIPTRSGRRVAYARRAHQICVFVARQRHDACLLQVASLLHARRTHDMAPRGISSRCCTLRASHYPAHHNPHMRSFAARARLYLRAAVISLISNSPYRWTGVVRRFFLNNQAWRRAGVKHGEGKAAGRFSRNSS